jgi:16S rRNA (guanine527-N7)-methyltransferase
VKDLEKALQTEQIDLDSKKIEKLEEYINLLEKWNRVHNLTGAKSREKIIENIIDSIYPITFVAKPKSLLDVGTGAGFPGMILAIAWDDSEVVLAEPLNKRASFLRFVASSLDLDNVSVFKDRVEKLEHSPFDLISSRAVTDTKLLLDLTKNVANKKTQYLFYKGSRVFDELESLKLKYDIIQKNKRNYLWIKSNDS